MSSIVSVSFNFKIFTFYMFWFKKSNMFTFFGLRRLSCAIPGYQLSSFGNRSEGTDSLHSPQLTPLKLSGNANLASIETIDILKNNRYHILDVEYRKYRYFFRLSPTTTKLFSNYGLNFSVWQMTGWCLLFHFCQRLKNWEICKTEKQILRELQTVVCSIIDLFYGSRRHFARVQNLVKMWKINSIYGLAYF